VTERDSRLAGGEVGWTVQNELAQLEQAYESGDILGMPAYCLIGTEIDFRLYMNKPNEEQVAALESSRTMIASELSLLAPKDEAQAQRKADWLQQIPHLTTPELINYHIYRRLSVPTLDAPNTAMYLRAEDSPETTLEFVFGNGLYQTGYYDNPGSFEMRTQAAKPTIAMERIRRAITVAEETCNAFGAQFHYSNDQTNFSVWTRDDAGSLRPLHSLDNPEGQEIARKATAGMLLGLRDGMAALHPATTFTSSKNRELQIKAAPERGGTLRVVPGRFEQRRGVGAEKHVLGALVLLSGFAHGVTNPALDTGFVSKERQHLFVPGEGYDKVRDLYLLRALQESNVVDGRFISGSIDALNIGRVEGMLSSIIGAPAQEYGGGSYVIERLLGCISLAPDGRLVADERRFGEVIKSSAFNISLIEQPQETINDRLKRIKCIQSNSIITGAVDAKWTSGVTFHEDLEKFTQAASLNHIGRSTREVIRRKHEAAFTHDEAVVNLCHTTISHKLIPAEEKVALLQETIAAFPKADADTVIQLFRNEIERDIENLARSLDRYELKSRDSSAHDENIYDIENHSDNQERHAQLVALRVLLGDV